MSLDSKANKLLISRGFGAGWTTWNSGGMAEFIGRYEPIIEFLESGGSFNRKNTWEPGPEGFEEPGRTLLVELCEECESRFGETPYVGGAVGLTVVYAPAPAEVFEYDGNESLSPWGGGTVV